MQQSFGGKYLEICILQLKFTKGKQIYKFMLNMKLR